MFKKLLTMISRVAAFWRTRDRQQGVAGEQAAKPTIVVIGKKGDGKTTLLRKLCEIDGAAGSARPVGLPSSTRFVDGETWEIIHVDGPSVDLYDVPGEHVQNYIKLRLYYNDPNAVDAVLDQNKFDLGNEQHVDLKSLIDNGNGFTVNARAYSFDWTSPFANPTEKRTDELRKLHSVLTNADCVLLVMQPSTVESQQRRETLDIVRETLAKLPARKPRMVGLVYSKYDLYGIVDCKPRFFTNRGQLADTNSNGPKDEPWLSALNLNGFFSRQATSVPFLQGYKVAVMPSQPWLVEGWGGKELLEDFKLHVRRGQISQVSKIVKLGLLGALLIPTLILGVIAYREKVVLGDFAEAFKTDGTVRTETQSKFDNSCPEVQKAIAVAIVESRFSDLAKSLGDYGKSQTEYTPKPWVNKDDEDLFSATHIKTLKSEMQDFISLKMSLYEQVTKSFEVVRLVGATSPGDYEDSKKIIENSLDAMETLEATALTNVAPVDLEVLRAFREAAASHFDLQAQVDEKTTSSITNWQQAWRPRLIDFLRTRRANLTAEIEEGSMWFYKRYNPYYAPSVKGLQREPLGFRALTSVSPFPEGTNVFAFETDRYFGKGWKFRLAESPGADWSHEVDFWHQTVHKKGGSPSPFVKVDSVSSIPITSVLHSIVNDDGGEERVYEIHYNKVDMQCSLYLLVCATKNQNKLDESLQVVSGEEVVKDDDVITSIIECLNAFKLAELKSAELLSKPFYDPFIQVEKLDSNLNLAGDIQKELNAKLGDVERLSRHNSVLTLERTNAEKDAIRSAIGLARTPLSTSHMMYSWVTNGQQNAVLSSGWESFFLIGSGSSPGKLQLLFQEATDPGALHVWYEPLANVTNASGEKSPMTVRERVIRIRRDLTRYWLQQQLFTFIESVDSALGKGDLDPENDEHRKLFASARVRLHRLTTFKEIMEHLKDEVKPLFGEQRTQLQGVQLPDFIDLPWGNWCDDPQFRGYQPISMVLYEGTWSELSGLVPEITTKHWSSETSTDSEKVPCNPRALEVLLIEEYGKRMTKAELKDADKSWRDLKVGLRSRDHQTPAMDSEEEQVKE